jgi:hypothetical protein
MSTLTETLSMVGRLLPLIIEWLRDRFEEGDTEEDIRRDIQDRRDEITERRKARDAQFREKFDRPVKLRTREGEGLPPKPGPD